MTFVTVNGVPGSASWNFAATVREDILRISGTEGELAFSVFGDEAVTLHRNGEVSAFERPNPTHVQQPLIQTVVDDLLGRDACPSTGQSARRTSAIMDQVLTEYYGGREDAFWERAAMWPGRHSMQSGRAAPAFRTKKSSGL